MPADLLQLPGQGLCALEASRVRGHGNQVAAQRDLSSQVIDPESVQRHVDRGNAERILECPGLVHLQREYRIRAGRLDQPRHMLEHERFTPLAPMIVARTGQVRNDRHERGRPFVPQGRQRQQEPRQATVRIAGISSAVQRLHEQHPVAGDARRQPEQGFGVRKPPLPEHTQLKPQGPSQPPAIVSRLIQREDQITHALGASIA